MTAKDARRAGISSIVLIAAQPFGPKLSAKRVSDALASGMREGGIAHLDLCEMEAPDLDARMKAARALVILAARLDEHTLLGSTPFEIATSARQAGVPCYAVARENALDPFDARILDLQVVIEAPSERALRSAGLRLAEIV